MERDHGDFTRIPPGCVGRFPEELPIGESLRPNRRDRRGG